ncbi:MAG TPA: polysaccharide deacetylase family protein [Candidatus Brocadiia bacterium]|nr:polysaccharide deacetylase family protein [Candidatus Brocadiia bacterium]
MNEHRKSWPEGKVCAASLTFDDGRPTQLSHAIPLMSARGLRGTFFLNPGGDHMKRLAPFAEAAGKGHEIGNHTIRHTCSRNFCFDPNGRGLEDATIEEIEADVLDAQRRLTELIGKPPVSFCYPCYQTDVGEGATRQSYVPIIAKHFTAARAGGEYSFFNHPLLVDLHCLWSCDTSRMPGAEMIGLAECAAKEGRWIIFVFHDVGPGRLGTSEHDFGLLIDHLAANRDRIWTAPMGEVAEHCKSLRART